MKYKIEEAKYDIVGLPFCCENVICAVKYSEDGKSKWLSAIEIMGVAEFYLSDNDIFDLLASEEEDAYAKLEKYQILGFNDIEFGEYPEILDSLNKSNDNDDKSLILFTLGVLTLDVPETKKLIKDSIGKYTSELDMPELDILD